MLQTSGLVKVLWLGVADNGGADRVGSCDFKELKSSMVCKQCMMYSLSFLRYTTFEILGLKNKTA